MDFQQLHLQSLQRFRDADSDANRDSNWYSDTDSNPNRHASADSDANSNGHPYTNAGSNSDSHRDASVDSRHPNVLANRRHIPQASDSGNLLCDARRYDLLHD